MLFNKKNIRQEKEIYFEYADYMFSICLRYIGSSELAEELMNNGFIKAFKNYHRFEKTNEDSLKYWMRKIMINECLMYLRKKKKIEFVQLDYEPVKAETFLSIDTFDFDITKLLDNLPFGYRTVFNLFALEGFSHAEISKKLNIKESTSRSQLTMARKLLKEQLINMGYEYKR